MAALTSTPTDAPAESAARAEAAPDVSQKQHKRPQNETKAAVVCALSLTADVPVCKPVLQLPFVQHFECILVVDLWYTPVEDICNTSGCLLRKPLTLIHIHRAAVRRPLSCSSLFSRRSLTVSLIRNPTNTSNRSEISLANQDLWWGLLERTDIRSIFSRDGTLTKCTLVSSSATLQIVPGSIAAGTWICSHT